MDGVGDREQASQQAVNGQIDHAGASAAQYFRLIGHGAPLDLLFLHQGGIAQGDRVVFHLATHANPGSRLKINRRTQIQSPLVRLGHNRLRQRVLTALVQAGRQA